MFLKISTLTYGCTNAIIKNEKSVSGRGVIPHWR